MSDPVEEKLNEILSFLRVLDMKLKFVEDDIRDLKTQELAEIKACVEVLAEGKLQNIQQEAAKNWKVERL
jgi:hypothetical protein